MMHGLATSCLLPAPEQQIYNAEAARIAPSLKMHIRASAGVAMQSAVQARAPHCELPIAARVLQDEVVDLLHGVPQLVVGVYRRQLQLRDQPVHLQAPNKTPSPCHSYAGHLPRTSCAAASY